MIPLCLALATMISSPCYALAYCLLHWPKKGNPAAPTKCNGVVATGSRI
jgi:hypothetical protein